MKAFISWLFMTGASEVEMALLEKEFGQDFLNWKDQ